MMYRTMAPQDIPEGPKCGKNQYEIWVYVGFSRI
jgi:hypothetical protein